MTIEIKLNGELRRVEAGCTLEKLIGSLQLPNCALAVAVNRKVVPRGKWAECVLEHADQVELVRAIGGG